MKAPGDILSGAKNSNANVYIVTKVQGYHWAM